MNTILIREDCWNNLTAEQKDALNALVEMSVVPVRRREPETGVIWVYASAPTLEELMDQIEAFLGSCGMQIPHDAGRVAYVPEHWEWDVAGEWMQL